MMTVPFEALSILGLERHRFVIASSFFIFQRRFPSSLFFLMTE
jgi:hypothetical protein